MYGQNHNSRPQKRTKHHKVQIVTPIQTIPHRLQFSSQDKRFLWIDHYCMTSFCVVETLI